MTSRDSALRFCDAAKALLTAHADDIALHGSARPQAQCEFARIGYGALEEACELVRELVVEVTVLRTGVNESEDVLLRMFAEVQAENERLRELMPCGHPRACLVSSDDERDSTVSCAWCADRARLQEVDAANRQLAVTGMHLASGLAESKRRVIELEAETKLNAAMLAQQCDLARDAENRLVVASHNVQTHGDLAIERGQEIKALKEQLRLARMRTTVGGGSVL